MDNLIGDIWRSTELVQDFNDICDCGGRFAGTEGERRARELLHKRLTEITASPSRSVAFEHQGWRRKSSRLRVLGEPSIELDSTALVLSPGAENLVLDLVDLGRGALEDFEARWDELRGRAVLVRHEFPFSVSHVHRRRKYGWAIEAGAAAFIIANHIPGIGVVTGSSGSGASRDIPSIGISFEAGAEMERRARLGPTRVRLDIVVEHHEAQSEHIIAEIPGKSDDVVVLCAHVDGHDLAESAMDNGSGVAVVLEVTRRLAPIVPTLNRGLRVIFFTVEEWALTGSRIYVQSLSPDERARISLVVNLDTVVGSPRMTALVSGRHDVARFVEDATRTSGTPVQPIYPLQANSDHYNFVLAGVPALRLIAGYEDPTSMTRYLLTPADTRDKVDHGQLRLAAMTTASLVHAACASEEPVAHHFDAAPLRARLDARDPWVSDRT
jgi:aminopeptidase YwaD